MTKDHLKNSGTILNPPGLFPENLEHIFGDPVVGQNDVPWEWQNESIKIVEMRCREYYNCIQPANDFYQKGEKRIPCTDFMSEVTSLRNILLAYRNLKENAGSTTPGWDGKTIRNLEEDYTVKELVEEVRNRLKNYKPDMVKRVYIPKKGSDKMRPLGIPTIMDRLVQQCIYQVLNPYLDAQFYGHSYGFRPDRGTKEAIARCEHLCNIQHFTHVVKVDIKSFFDNVNHNKLIRQLYTLGVRDQQLLAIIKAMLKAPIVTENGTWTIPEKGTPQGGIISPLLANVALNELDWWAASQWEEFPAKTRSGTDYATPSGKYNALRNSLLKEFHIVRYADDFLIFTKTFEEARKIKIATEMWLWERLKLETSPEKTQIINLKKQNAEFLGFRFKLHKKGDRLVLISHMNSKAIDSVTQKLREAIIAISEEPDPARRAVLIERYNQIVMGEHEYYKCATHITEDMTKIWNRVYFLWHNRIEKRFNVKKEGSYPKKYEVVKKRYGASEQMRFLEGEPVVPVPYIRTQYPQCMDQSFSRYTLKGYKLKHKVLKVDLRPLWRLMGQDIFNKSIEYHNNRIAKFCAQYGKCAVTGQLITIPGEIHCHHIRPLSRGHPRDDSYFNLVIVSESVHKLIHASKEDTINKYLFCVDTEAKLRKLNHFRKEAGNLPINRLADGTTINL